MKGKEIVAFDNQVVLGRKMLYVVFTIIVIATEVCEHLRLCQSVYLIGSERFIPKHLITLCIFLGLSSFEHTILIRPCQDDFTAVCYETPIVNSKTNFVLESSVTVWQELLVHDKFLKSHLVEYTNAVHVPKEMTRK